MRTPWGAVDPTLVMPWATDESEIGRSIEAEEGLGGKAVCRYADGGRINCNGCLDTAPPRLLLVKCIRGDKLSASVPMPWALA